MSTEVSRHNRAPLPEGEEARLETLNGKILAALEIGPQTNAALGQIALDYGRRIRDLRVEGHVINCEMIEGGLELYTMTAEPEPEWLVVVKVTLADGTWSLQQVKVRGPKEGTVRNRAQHLAHKVKICGAQLVDEIMPLNPFQLMLECPVCGLRHIDKPDQKMGWTNPPHKTHLCSKCGNLWRPFDFETEGV